MMTEWQECMQYLVFPEYECDDPQDHSYMSWFHFGMFKKIIGFQRILTLIARRYLFHTETGAIAPGDPYMRIEYARRALLAWCSISSSSKQEPRVYFPELHTEFPKLVNGAGNGWLIRHFRHIVKMVRDDENEFFNENTHTLIEGLSRGFGTRWVQKVRQFQVPIFQTNTKGAWTLRFDDVLASALDAGPLSDTPVVLPPALMRRLIDMPLSDRMREVTEAVLCYLYANRQPDTEWVLFPVCNFSAQWGTESFEKKWKPKIPKSFVIFETFSGSLTRAKIAGN